MPSEIHRVENLNTIGILNPYLDLVAETEPYRYVFRNSPSVFTYIYLVMCTCPDKICCSERKRASQLIG